MYMGIGQQNKTPQWGDGVMTLSQIWQ